MNSKVNAPFRRALHLCTTTANFTAPPHRTLHRLRPHHFSSTSTSTPTPPPDAAAIVQGPSLLVNTGSHYRPSPSLFLLPGLRSLPFWTAPPSSKSKISVAYNDPAVTRAVKLLEENHATIKKEYLAAVMGVTETDMSVDRPDVGKPLQPDYDVNLKGAETADKLHGGTWDWHSYVLSGETQPGFVERCPETVDVVRRLGDSLFFDVDDGNENGNENGNDGVGNDRKRSSTNPFGFCFFSTLGSKSYIKPHTGSMNLRLRLHLPLIVPPDTRPDAYSTKPQTKCGIRVGDQIRSWEEGKVVVLDDCYEHEAWNETEDVRVVLLVDIWHPDVRKEERIRIGKMFGYAVEQGWMGSGGDGKGAGN